MEVFVGTDIIEVNRIKEAMRDSEFIERVFTKKEIEYCESKSEGIKYQHYAARFAAKEAVFKAMSKLLNDKFSMTWKDIQITNDENCRPEATIQANNIFKLTNNQIKIDISISHIKELAIATAVVTIGDK